MTEVHYTYMVLGMLYSPNLWLYMCLGLQEADEGSAYRNLWDKILKNGDKSYIKSTIDALEKMEKDPSLTYTADKTVIRNHMIQMGLCSFVMMPEEYFPSGFGIGVRKGSPHIEHFNNA